MRKLITFLMLLPLVAFSQGESKDSLWNTSLTTTFNFSQVSLSNWVAGGKSSMTGLFMVNYAANYKKDKLSWDNAFDFRYGFIKEEKDNARKSDDLIDFSSKLGIEAGGKWNYSGMLAFKSQFTDGYNYKMDPRERISRFMAPGYFTTALGMDYKTGGLSILIAPVSGKFTFVTDELLSNEGAFGVDPGKKSRAELGGAVKVDYVKEIWKNVTFDSKLNLFSNYLDEPQNIDVDWKVQFNLKVNDYLSANLITHTIYDEDIKIKDPDTGESSPKVQFMESFGVGLTFKF